MEILHCIDVIKVINNNNKKKHFTQTYYLNSTEQSFIPCLLL